MISKVRSVLTAQNINCKNSTIVVALSGGADSMSLLHALVVLSKEFNFKIEACHINHCIRQEADSDEQFVKEFCEKLNVKLYVFKVNIPEIAGKLKIGLEECGRIERYKIFSGFSDCFIATAHTLSDKCETLLFNITRGCSVKGLCSIPAARDNIIRPLINCSRSEIEQYCSINGIPFVTDISNFDVNYSRNRIRNNVIPELKVINPSFENSVRKLSESSELDEDYFNTITDNILLNMRTTVGYDVKTLVNLHPALKFRVISKILYDGFNIDIERKHLLLIDSILEGGKVQLNNNLYVIVSDGVLYFTSENSSDFELWEYDFNNLKVSNDNCTLFAEVVEKKSLHSSQFVHKNMLDFDKLIGNITVRNRREGDRIKTVGSNCTKKLKKLFNERKLKDRYSIPVICDESGIVWVKGIGCDERLKITESTQRVLVIGDYSDD